MSTKKRKDSKGRLSPIHGFLAAAVLGLAVMPIAFAGAASDPGATAAAVSNAKFKKLKKRVTALEGRLDQQATGDLTGTYPNLTIRPNAVTTAKIADNAVTNPKVADDAINSAEIAANAVRASEFGPTTQDADAGTTDQGGVLNTADCDSGDMLSGGGLWSGTVGANVWINGTYPNSSSVWTLQGNNATGADRTLTPSVLCLLP